MAHTTLTRKYPLNCPFCDEPAYPANKIHRTVTPFEVYTLRECPMGHNFYSVESIPEDQSEIADRVKAIREAQRNGDE